MQLLWLASGTLRSNSVELSSRSVQIQSINVMLVCKPIHCKNVIHCLITHICILTFSRDVIKVISNNITKYYFAFIKFPPAIHIIFLWSHCFVCCVCSLHLLSVKKFDQAATAAMAPWVATNNSVYMCMPHSDHTSCIRIYSRPIKDTKSTSPVDKQFLLNFHSLFFSDVVLYIFRNDFLPWFQSERLYIFRYLWSMPSWFCYCNISVF